MLPMQDTYAPCTKHELMQLHGTVKPLCAIMTTIPAGSAEINLGALTVLQAQTLQEYSRGNSYYYHSITVAEEINRPSYTSFICWAASLLIHTIKKSEKTRENKAALYVLSS